MYNHRKPFLSYQRVLKAASQQMRRKPTRAEEILWKKVLRKRQLNGLLFYRQRPIDRFIVDFYCPQLMLAIEVDGAYHYNRHLADNQRTHILRHRYGVKIVRITNQLILDNMREARKILLDEIKKSPFPDKKRGITGGKTC